MALILLDTTPTGSGVLQFLRGIEALSFLLKFLQKEARFFDLETVNKCL